MPKLLKYDSGCQCNSMKQIDDGNYIKVEDLRAQLQRRADDAVLSKHYMSVGDTCFELLEELL